MRHRGLASIRFLAPSVTLGAEPEQARRVAAEHRTDPSGLITEDEILTAVAAYYTTGEPQQAFAVPA
ncbi:hypothetical protein ACFXB4_29300 [Streptomyces lavendulae]|uniref:hypothetical protein n=1 Tax=Streptomyces lavendulae TaxID=1914 RepID=UPI0036CE4A26